MKSIQFLLSLACAATVTLVAAAPQVTPSPTSTQSLSTTLKPSGTGISDCVPTAGLLDWMNCVAIAAGAHSAPYKLSNGTASDTTLAQSSTAPPITASATTFSTIATTSSSSVGTPSPTGTWNDEYGDLDASEFSVLILPGTKNVVVQTISDHGRFKFLNLQCPSDGDDFETIGDYVKSLLPHDLTIHGGNVCSGTLKIGASFDNTWVEYSTLERINVPTSNRCNSIGSTMRCVMPMDPK